MKRSLSVAVGAMGLVVALLTAALPADEPAKKTEAVKPPWQRLLQGEDAKKAAEQEKQLTALQEAGKFEDALKVAQALAELRNKVQDADHWQTVNARYDVEAVRRVLKATKEEQQSYSRALSLQHEAEALFAKGRYREAHPLFEQVLSVYRKVLGEEHPDTGTGYKNLAYNLNAQAKYRDAEEGLRKALAIHRKMLGEEHPATARSYDYMAANQEAQGKYKDAEAGYRKGLAIDRKVLGEEHPETAAGYNNVASNLRNQGKYKDAEEGLRKALAILRKVRGEEHPDTAQCSNNVAVILDAQGKYTEAEEGFRRALAIYRKLLGPNQAKSPLQAA